MISHTIKRFSSGRTLTSPDRVLKISESLALAIKRAPFNISSLTGLQAKVFSDIFKMSNAFIHSETGSGKTLAVLLPVLSRLIASYEHERMSIMDSPSHAEPSRDALKGVRLLIIVPTKELAQQTSHVLTHLTSMSQYVRHISIVGGQQATNKQVEWIQLYHRPNVLICTPGRLISLLENYGFHEFLLDHLETVFVDEIEKLTTEKFIPHFLKLMSCILFSRNTNLSFGRPGQEKYVDTQDTVHCLDRGMVQIILTSATTNTMVESICRQLLGSHFIRANGTSQIDYDPSTEPEWTNRFPEKLSNYVGLYKPDEFQDTLESLIWYLSVDSAEIGGINRQIVPRGLVLVIFPTVRLLQYIYVATRIRRRTRKAALGSLRLCALHSRLPPEKRRTINAEILSGWGNKDGAQRFVLFTTDLISRGLDFPPCNVISVMSPPVECIEATECTAIHRAGRSARMGNRGAHVCLFANILYELKYGKPTRDHLIANPASRTIITPAKSAILDLPDILATYSTICQYSPDISLYRERDLELLDSYCLAYRSLLSHLSYQENFISTFHPKPIDATSHGQELLICARKKHLFDRKCNLVSTTNQMILSTKFNLLQGRVPTLTRKLAQKLELEGIPGIRIGSMYETERDRSSD